MLKINWLIDNLFMVDYRRTLLVLITFVFCLTIFGCNSEHSAWNRAKNRNTIESYKTYLKEYDHGVHVAQARQLLAERQEDLDWKNIKSVNRSQQLSASEREDSLKNFISRYPSSVHIIQAKELIIGDKLSDSISSLLFLAMDGCSLMLKPSTPNSFYSCGSNITMFTYLDTLSPWGVGKISYVALRGSMLRVGPEGRGHINGKVQIKFFFQHKKVMDIVIGVAANKMGVIDSVGMDALVQGIPYRHEKNGNWSPLPKPKSRKDSKQ